MKKNFVLDTNVILHDYSCIDHFEDNDIYLPITVLEELDRFKKGSEQIHYNARAFVRRLDELTSNELHLRGASLAMRTVPPVKLCPKKPWSTRLTAGYLITSQAAISTPSNRDS